jgi:hypothetical protein
VSNETSEEHKRDVRRTRAILQVIEAAQAMHPLARSRELNNAIQELDNCTAPVCKHLRVAGKCMACLSEETEASAAPRWCNKCPHLLSMHADGFCKICECGGYLDPSGPRGGIDPLPSPHAIADVRIQEQGALSEPEPFEVDGVRYLTDEESQRQD